jgi:hypothetical protein
MTRAELEAAMLKAHLNYMGKSMVADPQSRIAKMAEPAWQEIEQLRKQLRRKRSANPS